MIHLAFELSNPSDVLEDFSRGHVTLVGNHEVVSSRDSAEDMMIFVEMIRILDNLQSLLLTSQKSYTFESVTSRPFYFKVEKISFGQIRVVYRERMIGEANLKDFSQLLWKSIGDFARPYLDLLLKSRIADDLISALQEFKRAMTAYQPPVKKQPKPKRK